MEGLLSILEKIKVRPGMYLGQASANNLFVFLEGYMTARHELGIQLSQDEIEFYDHFHPWLENRLGITTSNSWAAMIELQCLNEKVAFEHFFTLLDEFFQREKLPDVQAMAKMGALKAEPVKASQGGI